MITRTRLDNKKKGVLLPVFSLPSKYGIGCFSREAKQFIDWLSQTGHSYWQILPLNPTGMADSPYQPLSSFAGNAYFIDPEQLVEQDLLLREELEDFYFGEDETRVEYDELYESRMEMLRIAYRRFVRERAEEAEYRKFLADNASWLEDYAIFMALREEYGKELSWDEWPDPLRCRDEQELENVKEQFAEEFDFYRWTQYEFYRQWGELKAYANEAGVKIIGDMPVYVSYDSADCWADPDQFQLDEDLQPTMIAGVPPDQFAAEGQLWGNPLYDWEKMKKNGYRWWVSRIRQSFVMYDVIRLDHFRGYEAYYSCKADAPNGMNGIWRPGPGMDLFRQLEKTGIVSDARELSERFIAEDLGFLTEGVHKLLADTGFAGTKVLQFAFDGDPENLYLPENYGENCVVYTGTHDNDTTAGWFRGLSQDERAGILQYLGYSGIDAWWLVLESDAAIVRGEKPDASALVHRDGGELSAKAGWHPGEPVPDPAVLVTDLLIETALDSRAKIAIIPLQDYLRMGSEARTNTPGTIVNNWCVRIPAAGMGTERR